MSIETIPYKVLWYCIPLVLIILLFGSKGTFEIQMHDTYVVSPLWHVGFIITSLLALTGGIYWLLREHRLALGLSLVHSVITALAVIGIAILAVVQSRIEPSGLAAYREHGTKSTLLLLVVVCIQIVFVFNIVVGLIRGKRSS